MASVALRIEDVTAIPETAHLPIGVMATGTGSVSAVTVDITYPKTDLRYVETALDTGLCTGATVHATVATGNPEFATVTITLTLAQPTALPSGETRLFDVILSLGGGLVPGDVYPLTFARAPRVTIGGAEVQASVDAGSITVATGNYLIMENAWGYPGQSHIPVELKVFNADALMGMQVGGTFDKNVLQLVEISQANTMTESLQCEFFEPIIDNEQGYFLLGVLLDAMAPLDPAKRYPAGGYRQRVARLYFDVASTAQEEQDVPLRFVDGLGDPPMKNRVVVDHESVTPSLLDGNFRIGTAPMFLRGEVNGDGRINIADPVMITLYLFRDAPVACVKAADVDDDGEVRLNDVTYLLNYLFTGGRQIPPPFPTRGLDPTPDDLPCAGR
jgi:hypothetical protein